MFNHERTSRLRHSLKPNKKITTKKNIRLYLIVTGSHLQKKTGNTINEIKLDQVRIYKLINFKKSSYQEDITNILSKSSKLLKKIDPKILIILGDRYEIFACALAAYIEKIPIAHIHGGEVTTGSMDDTFRNCITKMSYLHFCSYRKIKKKNFATWREIRIKFSTLVLFHWKI